MKIKTPEKPARKKLRNITAATAIAAGSIAYGAHQIESIKETQKESAQAVDDLSATVGSLNAELTKQEQRLQYMHDVNGFSQQDIDKHLAYPTIPKPETPVSPEVAKKHRDATVYILATSAETVTPDTPLGFACTAVKVDDTTLTSARHCFPDVTDAPLHVRSGKGGGEPIEHNLPYTSYLRYFAAATPELTYGQAQEQAVEITGYGTDYFSGDSALLSVEPNDWFSDIESLPLATGSPQKGDAVHIAGYPNAVEDPVTAQGVVLGTVQSNEFYGNGYVTDLLVVGVTPESTEDFTCNFGASGSSVATADGHSYGALAQVTRSFTPEGSIDVVPDGQKIMQFEEQLETRFAGTDYILCAYSPILPVAIKPLVAQEMQSPYSYDSK